MAPLDYLKSPPFSPAEEFQLNFWRRWLALRPPLNMRALAKVVESDGHSCLNQWASGRGINNFVEGELALRELLLRTEVCEDRHSPGDSYWGKVMENLANELAVCHNNDLARRRAMSLRSVGRDLMRAADELSKRSIETIVNQVPR